MIDYTDENLGMYADLYEEAFGCKVNQESIDLFLSKSREEQSETLSRMGRYIEDGVGYGE